MKQLGSDCTGFIGAEVIAGFKRVQQITSELELVVQSLRRIEELEVQEGPTGVEVRRRTALPPKVMESEAGSQEAEEELQMLGRRGRETQRNRGVGAFWCPKVDVFKLIGHLSTGF